MTDREWEIGTPLNVTNRIELNEDGLDVNE